MIAPTWYFAPQRREIAQAGWQMVASLSGALGDAPISVLESADTTTMLLQTAGEFVDPAAKKRIWDAAEAAIEPTWNHAAGEFTLGFGLNEAHPRGQLNARAMAGWVCTEGAWSRIFNAPNLGKFDEPTLEGVDFPRVALSEARWDGRAMHVAAHPRNTSEKGRRTSFYLTNIPSSEGWFMTSPRGETIDLPADGARVVIELVVDNEVSVIRQK